MRLNISFPENMIVEQLLELKKIPCLCKVAGEFKICFSEPALQSSEGVVSDWERKELELRVVGGGGGNYTHYNNGMITLRKVDKDVYEIVDLELFHRCFGWCVVMVEGEYAPPKDFSCE